MRNLPCNAKTGRPLECPHALPAICPHGTLIVTTHTVKTIIYSDFYQHEASTSQKASYVASMYIIR